MRALTLLLVLLAAVPTLAVAPNAYQVGQLLDFQVSSMAKSNSNCTLVVVVVRDLVVHAMQCANFPWNMFNPAEFTVRGDVEVRFEGDRLMLRRPNGKELKARILRRTRVAAEERRRMLEDYSARIDRPADGEQMPQQFAQPR